MRWARNATRTRAVAPHTVSPGSSKKEMARSGRPPVLLVEGVVLQQLGERHLEDLDDLAGMGNEARQRVDDPDEGRDREARPDGGERVELGDDLDRGRAAGRSPPRPHGAPRRGGCRRRRDRSPPPGKAISPWWDGMVSGRFVRTTCASPSASNSGTSTAAGRLPGISNGGGCGGGRAAQRSRTWASESRRRSAGTWLHGGGPPVRAPAGRGMRCAPPRATPSRRQRTGVAAPGDPEGLWTGTSGRCSSPWPTRSRSTPRSCRATGDARGASSTSGRRAWRRRCATSASGPTRRSRSTSTTRTSTSRRSSPPSSCGPSRPT